MFYTGYGFKSVNVYSYDSKAAVSVLLSSSEQTPTPSIYPFLFLQLLSNCFLYRGYYIVIVPLKRSRGKFIKPWESPDEMELDEVLCVFVVIFSFIKITILLVVCD